MHLNRFALAAAASSALTLTAAQAFAWGATGHRLIGQVATESLPVDLPAFLHTREASDAIGEMSREPDRSRGAGQPHDSDLDPGHFIDLTDQGVTLGGSPIAAMPPNRFDYEISLHSAGTTVIRGGYLYYNLLDGYEQLVQDFAYYRVETAALKSWTNAQDKSWLAADLKLREAIILRDLGWWSHFVGDASQPMHVSIHYNGWGDYPNPNHYTQDKIHLPFEGAYVQANVTKAAVRAAMAPATVCAGPIQACVAAYLSTTLTQVAPVYGLWTAGAFAARDPRATALATQRVAAGAAALRDLTTKAWIASQDASVGYPAIGVRAVMAGAPVPFGVLYGED